GNTAANGLGDTTGAPTPGPNVDGNVTSAGHNLIGVATEATGFSGVGDQLGANPMLAALADNGGPTQTMALTPGSPRDRRGRRGRRHL
ncbi:MAG: choice-of-anchor Q domain-containing protein, partial [Pyrinomonadaceae bacterium]